MLLLIFGFWVALNGRVTVEILGLGAGITALAMFFLCRFCDWSLKKEGKLYRLLPRLIGYIGILLWEILKANLSLLRLIWAGRPDPVVRVIRTNVQSRLGKMLLANSITLTPGTVTLACRGDELTVHCITEGMAAGLDDLIFEKYLVKMEGLIHG